MEAEVIAARQHGLITASQALAGGLSVHQVRRRVRSGRWRVVRPGVYAIAGVPPSWRQAVQAVLLSVGAACVASHWTAARLLGCRVPPDLDGIEVTGPRPQWVRLPGVVGHRSLHLFDADGTSRDGIPCTAAARLVVDMSSRLDERELGRMADDLQRRRLLRLADLAGSNARLPAAPGRSPATVHALLAARWAGYDPGDSDFETRVLRLIAAAGLPLPRQQFRVEVHGRRRYIDLAWPDARLAVEVQGPVHRWQSRHDDDRVRINEIVLLGWRPLEIVPAMSDALIVDQITRGLEALDQSARG